MTTQSTETPATLGPFFFKEQDRLQGGPSPALCAPNYRAIVGSMPPMDRAAHEQFAKAFYAGFPGIHHTIEQVIASSDCVAVRFTIAGKHAAPFMGIPATGRSIKVTAIAQLRFENGKVVELNAVFDQMGLMQQLGVLPA
jgi:predicted ester cyclase